MEVIYVKIHIVIDIILLIVIGGITMVHNSGVTANSMMKMQVKEMGGDVDVDLRFSIRWNDKKWDKNDLDAHCTEPDGNEIYFVNKRSGKTGGWLDVDIINPLRGKPAVENIQFKTRNKMDNGEYLFRVHQYTYRNGDEGFEAELEFDNNIYNFDNPYKLNQGEYVEVAKVILHADGHFELIRLLENSNEYAKKQTENIEQAYNDRGISLFRR